MLSVRRSIFDFPDTCSIGNRSEVIKGNLVVEKRNTEKGGKIGQGKKKKRDGRNIRPLLASKRGLLCLKCGMEHGQKRKKPKKPKEELYNHEISSLSQCLHNALTVPKISIH
jgi:hypothetical protein